MMVLRSFPLWAAGLIAVFLATGCASSKSNVHGKSADEVVVERPGDLDGTDPTLITVSEESSDEDLLAAANAGDIDAQYLYGLRYLTGGENPERDLIAFVWLLKVAQAGHPSTQFRIGSMYFEGIGTERDLESAIHWWTASADQGYSWALVTIGDAYIFGRHGLERDRVKGYEYIENAARSGDTAAQIFLARYLIHGIGIEQDLERGYYWIQKAADSGDPHGKAMLGVCYFHGRGVEQDVKKAVEIWRELSDKGNVEGQSLLGGYYLQTGQYEDGMKYVRLAAEQGWTEAQTTLGIELLAGDLSDGTQTSIDEGVRWLEEAIKMESVMAAAVLGDAYLSGHPMPRDIDKGIQYLTIAADRGDVAAQEMLGISLLELIDSGYNADPLEGLEWLRRAANQGSGHAQFAYGWISATGKYGPPNFVESMKWIMLSADHGFPDSDRALEAIRPNVTQNQFDDARARADAWRPRPEVTGEGTPPGLGKLEPSVLTSKYYEQE